MAARAGHYQDEDSDKAAKKAADDAANKSTKTKADPSDPAEQPGSTGNAPTVSGGIKRTPTPEEDEEAKEQAKATNEQINEELGGGYRKAAQTEAKAIADGASALGKERVVVTDERGNPMTAVRGMSETAIPNASATNPTLMANNAIAAGAPPPEPPAPLPEAREGEEGEDVPEVIVVTDLHGKGGQPHAG